MIKWPLICLLALPLFWSCESLYVAQPSIQPMISQEGEVQAQMGISGNGFSGGAAWAPVKHFAFIGNASNYTVEFDSIQEPRYRHTYGELGLGYWTRLEKYLRFELYSGMGWGVSGDLPRRDNYRRFFIQPNIGTSGEYVDASFSPKFSFVSHTDTRNATNAVPLPVTTAFWEPSLSFRAGYRELKFQIQASYSIPLSTADFDYRAWNIGFGAHLTLGKDFEKYTYTYD